MPNIIEPSDSIEHYLQHKLGVSHSLASAFLKALTEWISIKLRRRQVALLPYIGKFTLKVTPKSKRAHYEPGQTLKLRIREELSKESLFLASLTALRSKLNIQRDKENKKHIPKLEEELRTERRVVIKDERDILRFNLIYYFQRHYPHRADWKHPTTNKLYSWEQMHGLLTLFKNASWRDYKILLTAFIRIDDRRYLLKRWKMPRIEYKQSLQRSLDAMIMLLEFPEMTSEELTSILEAEKFKV